MAKKRIKSTLIKNHAIRKSCFKKRRDGLIKKLNEVSILCGIDACAIIDGPGVTKPKAWPSKVKTKRLLKRFERIPLVERLKRNVSQRICMLLKIQKTQQQLDKLKAKNDEKHVSNLMHQIDHDGKSLSDFEATDLRRLLCFVEEKLKIVRKKTGSSEEQLSLNSPPTPLVVSCPLQNDVGMVLPQENFRGFKSGSGVLPPDHFGGHIGGSESRSGALPLGNFGSLNGESSNWWSGVLHHGNIGGLIGGSDHLGVLHHGTIGGLIGGSAHLGVLPQGNFRGHDGVSDHSWVSPQGNFGGLNAESNLGVSYGSSSTGGIGSSDIWPSYANFGSTVGGSYMTLPFSNSGGNINGTYMGIPQLNENQGGLINNVGLWSQSNNFGVNNDGAAVGSSNANFFGINNGRNLKPGFPFPGNFSSGSERS